MGMLSPVQTVAPEALPVTLPEAKAHLRVLHDDDDDLISSLIETATMHLDGWTGILGRALITQTWRQDFERFGDKLRLPLGPVASVTEVTYFDADGVSQTLATSVYRILADVQGTYVAMKPDQDWPTTFAREDAVSVTFVAGQATVPAPIRAAILIHISHLYRNRGAVAAGMQLLPLSHHALIAPFRSVGI